MKNRLFLPCIVLLSLAACQNEQPATSTAPASQQTSNTATSPAASTVAVTKEVVETHAKELQAKMAEGKQVAAKAAEQLTQSVTDSAAAVKAAAATQAAEAAKAAAATKAAEAAEAAAATKAAEAAKAAAATKATEAAKAAAANKAAEAAKAAAVTKAAETAKAAAATAAVASLPIAAAPMGAVGNAAKGKSLANKCKGCHNFTAKKKVGPGLQGVVGRKAGSMAGMKYSAALAAGGWDWNEKNLAVWLCDSKKAVKTLSGDPSASTKMGAQRICDATKQADLIAFLKTL